MLLVGIVIGFVFSWKIALVGLGMYISAVPIRPSLTCYVSSACVPALGLAGFAHLVRLFTFRHQLLCNLTLSQWLVVKNDKRNEISHRCAAHLACEAAGSIRTVAALTREDDCCRFYSQSLEDPLKNARRVALRSGVIYGLSQGMTFWVISLVFWYGARQVAALKYTPSEFFVAFMVFLFCFLKARHIQRIFQGVTFGALQFGKVLAAIPDISKCHIAACDIFTLLDSQPEIDANSTEGKDPNQRKGRILLNDVHFRYPNRAEIAVLRGLSMKVKPRSYVAVTGASGAGKSTMYVQYKTSIFTNS
jgi:ATP-binding cassette, subfamily B (MDR/TAP), member 1